MIPVSLHFSSHFHQPTTGDLQKNDLNYVCTDYELLSPNYHMGLAKDKTFIQITTLNLFVTFFFNLSISEKRQKANKLFLVVNTTLYI